MVFLSYHTKDRDIVRRVKAALEARGVSSFLDCENLHRGEPTIPALEAAILRCRGFVAFQGREEGPIQELEIQAALQRQIEVRKTGQAFAVVPVLLPGGFVRSAFLKLNTPVDLGREPFDAGELQALVRALKGGGDPWQQITGSGLDLSSILREVRFSTDSSPAIPPFRVVDTSDPTLSPPDLPAWASAGSSQVLSAFTRPDPGVLVTIDGLTDLARRYSGTSRECLNEILGTIWRRRSRRQDTVPLTERVVFTPADGSANRRGP